MSEQNPWGQTPPPNYGPPAGGPSGGLPPPSPPPPGEPPGGFAPPAYGGGPSGPQPPKRNTAAIIAAIVAAVVVVAAVIVTLVVTTGDDDAEQAQDPAASSSATEETPTEPTTEPTEAESTEPSDEATTDAPSDVPADAIEGDGYFFELPGIGWQDALDEAQSSGLGSTLDAIIVLGTSLELAQSNILVEALTAGGASELEDLEGQWKRNLGGSDGAVPDDIPDITIDGERAIGVRFTERENVNGLLIDQVAYLTLHEGNQYSIALSLPSDNDDVSEADFEKVLASWTWTG